MKKWDIVEVMWNDAIFTEGWMRDDERKNYSANDLLHRSVGYFYGRTKFSVRLVQSRQEGQEDITDALIEIPLSSVVKMLVIGSSRGK